MSTLFDRLQPTLEPEVFIPRTWQPDLSFDQERAVWDPIRFGEEQIRSLVSQIFLPGRPKPARQVVFTAVDFDTDVATISMQVGQVLSEQVSGSVCVVQANRQRNTDVTVKKTEPTQPFRMEKFSSLRDSSRRLSNNLWLAPADIFAEGNGSGFSTEPLSGRVAELRLDFDYAVLCGPPAGKSGQAALLGHLCDGVVLVLDANSTRRAAAQKAKETLYAANARLLGVVLDQRTFPIPEGIYRKL
jgi:protein-tyrosine kinase